MVDLVATLLYRSKDYRFGINCDYESIPMTRSILTFSVVRDVTSGNLLLIQSSSL